MKTQTTFAGPNPFAMAAPLMKGYVPPTRKSKKPSVTRGDLLKILADGKARNMQEVAEAAKGTYNSIGITLKAMAKTGMIGVRPRPVNGRRPVPEYFVWGENAGDKL